MKQNIPSLKSHNLKTVLYSIVKNLVGSVYTKKIQIAQT